MQTFEKRLSAGKIYGIEQEDGTCLILADCQVHPEACIKFFIPIEAARIYFGDEQRPPIQELFPDLLAEQREILVSGNSPAQWDRMCGKRMPKTQDEFVKRYTQLGYTFD